MLARSSQCAGCCYQKGKVDLRGYSRPERHHWRVCIAFNHASKELLLHLDFRPGRRFACAVMGRRQHHAPFRRQLSTWHRHIHKLVGRGAAGGRRSHHDWLLGHQRRPAQGQTCPQNPAASRAHVDAAAPPAALRRGSRCSHVHLGGRTLCTRRFRRPNSIMVSNLLKRQAAAQRHDRCSPSV